MSLFLGQQEKAKLQQEKNKLQQENQKLQDSKVEVLETKEAPKVDATVAIMQNLDNMFTLEDYKILATILKDKQKKKNEQKNYNLFKSRRRYSGALYCTNIFKHGARYILWAIAIPFFRGALHTARVFSRGSTGTCNRLLYIKPCLPLRYGGHSFRYLGNLTCRPCYIYSKKYKN